MQKRPIVHSDYHIFPKQETRTYMVHPFDMPGKTWEPSYLKRNFSVPDKEIHKK